MNRSRPGSRLVPSMALLLFIGIGMCLVWYSTVWGAGLISDSFQYTASARSLATGKGFSLPYGEGELQPMTKYPPMFSILLAGFELMGASAIKGARFLNIFLFGLNIFLVFYSTSRLARSHGFALLAALLFAISFVMVEVHSWALSEPLYISLSLTAILMIQKYFEETKSTWIALAALAAAAAFLTRYVGVSLVLALGIVLLMHGAAIRQRVRDLFLFGFIAVLPIALWSVRGYLLTRTLNDRTLAFHPLTIKNYVSAIDAVYGWFFPRSLVEGAEKIFLALTAVALILLILFFWRSRRVAAARWVNDLSPEKRVSFLHGIYIVLYGLIIIVFKTWLDADIGLSDRILSPMLVSLLILLTTGLAFLWNNYGRTRPFVILVGIGLLFYYAADTFFTVQGFHASGLGIARRGWSRSDVIQSLRSYPDTPMYTNSISSLYLWSDRAGYGIPEFELLKEQGTNRRVLVIVFHHVPPTGKRLDALVSGLKLIEEDQVASIYTPLDP